MIAKYIEFEMSQGHNKSIILWIWNGFKVLCFSGNCLSCVSCTPHKISMTTSDPCWWHLLLTELLKSGRLPSLRWVEYGVWKNFKDNCWDLHVSMWSQNFRIPLSHSPDFGCTQINPPLNLLSPDAWHSNAFEWGAVHLHYHLFYSRQVC